MPQTKERHREYMRDYRRQKKEELKRYKRMKLWWTRLGFKGRPFAATRVNDKDETARRKRILTSLRLIALRAFVHTLHFPNLNSDESRVLAIQIESLFLPKEKYSVEMLWSEILWIFDRVVDLAYGLKTSGNLTEREIELVYEERQVVGDLIRKCEKNLLGPMKGIDAVLYPLPLDKLEEKR